MEKITRNTPLMLQWVYMTERVEEVAPLVLEMIYRSDKYEYLLLCDELNIRGHKLYKLFNLCEKDFEKFKIIVRILKDGNYSYKLIKYNLLQETPTPFIEMDLEYLNSINKNTLEWFNYCQLNSKLFSERIMDIKTKKLQKINDIK